MGGVYWEGEEIGMAVLGGIFIAISTSLNLLIMGRITGMSGMFFTILRFKKSEGLVWKLCCVFGIVLVPFLFYYGERRHLDINGYSYRVLDDQEEATSDLDLAGWAVGGFLVGFGTKLGNGCTSGHGVCGIPRLSIRSFVAVGCFMTSAVGIATIRFYAPFFDGYDTANDTFIEVYDHVAQAFMALFFLVVLFLVLFNLIAKSTPGEKFDPVISFIVGGIFGMGLLVSGMCRRTKIRDFLSLGDGWDPSLMFVMVAAVCVNFLTFRLILKSPNAPLLKKECQLPKKKTLDWQVILGPTIFGLGWGISGFCPGPGMVNVFLNTHCGLYMIALAVGQLCAFVLTSWVDRKSTLKAKPVPSPPEVNLAERSR